MSAVRPLLTADQVSEFELKTSALKALAAKNKEAKPNIRTAIKLVMEFYATTPAMMSKERTPKSCAELAENLAIVAQLEHIIIMDLLVQGPRKPTIEKESAKWI